MLYSHRPHESTFNDFYEGVNSIRESHDDEGFGKQISSSNKNIKKVLSRESVGGREFDPLRNGKSLSYNSFADEDFENFTGYGKNIQNYQFDSHFSMGNMPSTSSISQMSSFNSMPTMNGAVNSRFKAKLNSGKKKVQQGETDFRIKYKTEVCKYWAQTGNCEFGDNCAFAHGKNEIRQKIHISNNYKTKKCIQFHDTGYCPYGHRCQFIHNIRKDSLSNPTIESKSYNDDIETLEIWHTHDPDCYCCKRRPRLPTFQKYSSDKLGTLLEQDGQKSPEKNKSDAQNEEELSTNPSSSSKTSEGSEKRLSQIEVKKYKLSSNDDSSDSSC